MSASARIKWIDYAKGVAIFLMVIGHTSLPAMLGKWIWSFHMPLFFVISGLLFCSERYPQFWGFCRKRIWSLLVPYICFTIICAGLDWWLDLFTADNKHPFSWGWDGVALWFLPVLFCCEIIYYWLSKLGKAFSLIAVVALSLFGYWLYREGVHLPYKAEVIPFAMLFYGIGNVFQAEIRNFKSPWWLGLVLLAMSVALSIVLPKLDMAHNCYGVYYLNIPNALLGTAAMLCLCQQIEKFSRTAAMDVLKRTLSWLGKNTLPILCLSQTLSLLLRRVLEFVSMPGALRHGLNFVLMWVLLVLVTIAIQKYAPILFGKRSTKR